LEQLRELRSALATAKREREEAGAAYRRLSHEARDLRAQAQAHTDRAEEIKRLVDVFVKAKRAEKAAQEAAKTPWQRFLAAVGIITRAAEKVEEARERRIKVYRELAAELDHHPKSVSQALETADAEAAEASWLKTAASAASREAYRQLDAMSAAQQRERELQAQLRQLQREAEPEQLADWVRDDGVAAEPQPQRQQDRGWEPGM
jgi:hypothetical protein